MRNNQHDVIVVGAGPVGSYTAYLLAKEGLDVGIFERNPDIGRDVNCTGIVSPECLRKLNLPDEVVFRQISSIKAVSPSGNAITYQAASPLAYVVNRGLFDSEVHNIAHKEGVTTYLNTKVEEIDITSSAFKIKSGSGAAEREFSAKVGVVATGFELRSFQKGPKRPVNFLFGIQTDVMMENVTDVEVYFGEKVAPGSFGWIVPTNGKSAKIGLIVKKKPAEFLKQFLKSPHIEGRINGFENNIRCSPIPLKKIPKSYAERLVVVGEAAGQVKTTTGGGIYFGLLCAEFAAQTILSAFSRGDYSESVFKEYESLWRKKLDPELKAGVMLRNIFSKFSDHQIDLLIDLAKRDGLMPIIDKAGFDWHRDIISYLIRHFLHKKLFGK
jgi:digeranylgeranylglycerophospholipid reductase